MANASRTDDTAAPIPINLVVRTIQVADLRDALARGIEDFRQTPTQLVFLGGIYPTIAFVAVLAARGGDVLALIYPLVAGVSLMGPLVSVGVYELSRRREQGLPVSWINAFDVFRSPSIFSILLLAPLMCVIFVAWLVAAQVIYQMTMGATAPASIGEFLNLVFTTGAGWSLIIIGNLVGFLFAVLVLTITVVSFPLLVDRNVGPIVAVQTSIRAVRANPVTMSVWGLIVAAGLVIGCLPAFIGLAIVLPVLGHGTWHLYRKVVEH